jgi:hypothetical protein
VRVVGVVEMGVVELVGMWVKEFVLVMTGIVLMLFCLEIVLVSKGSGFFSSCRRLVIGFIWDILFRIFSLQNKKV